MFCMLQCSINLCADTLNFFGIHFLCLFLIDNEFDLAEIQYNQNPLPHLLQGISLRSLGKSEFFIPKICNCYFANC